MTTPRVTLPPEIATAMRAVVALHAPIWCNALDDYQCAECGADLTDAAPNCPTIAIIEPILAHWDDEAQEWAP